MLLTEIYTERCIYLQSMHNNEITKQHLIEKRRGVLYLPCATEKSHFQVETLFLWKVVQNFRKRDLNCHVNHSSYGVLLTGNLKLLRWRTQFSRALLLMKLSARTRIAKKGKHETCRQLNRAIILFPKHPRYLCYLFL